MPNSKKLYVKKKKAIKSKSSVFVRLNSKKLGVFAELELQKLNWIVMFDWVKTWIFYKNRKEF